MKKRASDGLGNGVCQAQVLSFMDEDSLWSLGLLGTHSPTVLLDTVVFLLGMSCRLRAGEEHRSVRSPPFRSQFEFCYDEKCQLYFKYKEDLGLKTNKGGIKQRKVEPKDVFVYQLSSTDRCPARILNLYLSKLPKKRTCEALYLQPCKKFSPKRWYFNNPVGANTLRNTIKELCKNAGLPGYYTSHSLMASCATRLYVNDILLTC